MRTPLRDIYYRFSYITERIILRANSVVIILRTMRYGQAMSNGTTA